MKQEKYRKQKYRKSGFTLLELLVVVLIIGILAAVTLAQYKRTVEQSYSAEALTLIKAVAQSAKLYAINRDKEFTSFDMLDVDIPWAKSTRVIGSSTDTLSNGIWALEVENASGAGWGDCIFITRITGKYKGAGFRICNYSRTNIIYCQERTTGTNIPFTPSLPPGAYCKNVMQWKFKGENQWSRSYLP